MKTQINKTDAACAIQASGRAGLVSAAQATAGSNYLTSNFIASLILAVLLALIASAQAGVNLETTPPPGYSKPLTLYVSNGKILGAWAVGNKGNRDAGPFEVGFYVGGKRVMSARFTNGLKAGYRGYGTDAPFDFLPDGKSTVEVKVNDTRTVSEDTYSDNSYTISVTVNRGGGGGTTSALSRSEAAYKYPSSFGSSSPNRIISRMTDMFAVEWVPTSDFVNWRVGVSTGSYKKGARYYGLPYSQANPQTDRAGFIGYLPAMKGTLNSSTSAGPDCSGSISIAWELPWRHTTSTFDVSSSNYFTTVVGNGKLASNASKIMPGDAIVSKSWGHMVLVLSAPANGKVTVLESTADQGINSAGQPQRWAVVKNTRSLSDLDAQNCRVIRRGKLN